MQYETNPPSRRDWLQMTGMTAAGFALAPARPEHLVVGAELRHVLMHFELRYGVRRGGIDAPDMQAERAIVLLEMTPAHRVHWLIEGNEQWQDNCIAPAPRAALDCVDRSIVREPPGRDRRSRQSRSGRTGCDAGRTDRSERRD